MIIGVWILLRIAFLATAVIVLLGLLRNDKCKDAVRTLTNGMREAFRGCGFSVLQNDRYTVELYKWIALDDGKTCEDCRERARWPAMDIADWMKKGLPRTPESGTKCGSGCRCQLVVHESKDLNRQPHHS